MKFYVKELRKGLDEEIEITCVNKNQLITYLKFVYNLPRSNNWKEKMYIVPTLPHKLIVSSKIWDRIKGDDVFKDMPIKEQYRYRFSIQ